MWIFEATGSAILPGGETVLLVFVDKEPKFPSNSNCLSTGM